jgi:hypothetical protein
MSKLITTSTLLLLLAAQPLPYRTVSTLSQDSLDDEEYVVYAAVIERLFAGDKVSFDTQSPVKLLVIKDHTGVDRNGDRLLAQDLSGGVGDYVRQWTSALSQEAVQDYRIKNNESHQLKGGFSLKIKHVFVQREELEQFLKEGRWEEFYKKYPVSGGFISFSRVGFNREKNEALVYFEHWCGGLCGSGIYLQLKKGEQGWKVSKVDRAWIS